MKLCESDISHLFQAFQNTLDSKGEKFLELPIYLYNNKHTYLAAIILLKKAR